MPVHYIKSETDLSLLDTLDRASVIGVDTETTGLVPQQSKIRLIQLCTGEDTFVVDLFRVDAVERLRPVLESPQIVKVLHNAKFDVKQLLYHYNLEMKNIFCTMLASKLLAMGLEARHSLAEVAWKWLGESVDKALQTSDWADQLTVDQVQYAATDARLVYRLHGPMDAELRKHKLVKVSRLEFRTVVPVAAMELRGFFVDPELLAVVTRQMEKQAEELEAAVLDELGGANDLPGMNTLNINAPEQVKAALLDRGIDVPDTNDNTLRPLAAKHSFIDNLLKYRHISRMLGSTLHPFRDFILPETRRIHARYHQIASPSGRFACSDPNIQQVPREKQVRTCFKPQTGNLFVIADYSQVELRVAAGLAQDQLMLETYRKGGDLHRLTAALTKGKHIDYVTASERQAAKAINFGLIYAMGPRGLQASARHSYGVEMTLEQAGSFRDRFFQNYKGIRNWQRELERSGRKRGYVRTAAGRIRSYKGREIRVTEMFNVPVQGTAAEGLKSALCIFWDKVKEMEIDAGVVAIIHDEIIVEVRHDQAERAKEILEQSMIQGISWLVPNVPFEAEAHISLSWAEK
ncbi:MAG: DNA polymerase [Acidobacteriota bacterium]|nr:DNA polymerase [Acidobacteriota bacterium]